jgi:hypothetical protein
MERFLKDPAMLKEGFEGKHGFEWTKDSEIEVIENRVNVRGKSTDHGQPTLSFMVTETMTPESIESKGYHYDFVASNIGGTLNVQWCYYKEKLAEILRYHAKRNVIDPGEIAIRSSFDALLDFLGKIGYLQSRVAQERRISLFLLLYKENN